MGTLRYSPLILSLLAAIAVALAIVAGTRRGKAGVTLGDGGNPSLQAAMRA